MSAPYRLELKAYRTKDGALDEMTIYGQNFDELAEMTRYEGYLLDAVKRIGEDAIVSRKNDAKA